MCRNVMAQSKLINDSVAWDLQGTTRICMSLIFICAFGEYAMYFLVCLREKSASNWKQIWFKLKENSKA